MIRDRGIPVKGFRTLQYSVLRTWHSNSSLVNRFLPLSISLYLSFLSLSLSLSPPSPQLPLYGTCVHLVPGVLRIGHGESEKVVNIERLHLEHDSGKSIHTVSDEYTLVDLNRSGTGLMEIVTKPDIHSGEEAAQFLQQLLLILEALGTCDGNLAEGSVRVDANVSIRPAGATEYGDRCEVKNINGVRFLSKAIEYERDRQVGLLEDGHAITMSTRNYDVATNTTVRIRGKEDETDYRYMPEPDLPPLLISEHQLADARRTLPILPRESVESLVRT